MKSLTKIGFVWRVILAVTVLWAMVVTTIYVSAVGSTYWPDWALKWALVFPFTEQVPTYRLECVMDPSRKPWETPCYRQFSALGLVSLILYPMVFFTIAALLFSWVKKSFRNPA